MTGISKDVFLRDYSKKIADGTAAIFAGAGLSRSAGFVDWRELLREVADDLGLQIDREHDLIAVAQYHETQRGTRAKLNEKILEEFTRDAHPSENHSLLARLPIRTYWTTNYDNLIEDAVKHEGKRVDVKASPESFAASRPGADVTVYKMHGDVSNPASAVLTKNDYETYSLSRELFTVRLKGDLVGLTFLFLGFSFTDPNIDHILSRIKGLLGLHVPTHYCVMRRPPPAKDEAGRADYEYEVRKLALRVDDLKRYGIQTVLVDDYREVTGILLDLNRRAFFNNIFLSGAAEVGSDAFDMARLLHFSRRLGHDLIERGFNLVSGYGLGIGSEVIVGAVEGAYLTPSTMQERLILRPFPRGIDDARKQEVYRTWRTAMLSVAGFAIYLAGNKKTDPGGAVCNSVGVMEEFEIATTAPLSVYPIPVGATGHAAEEIWRMVVADPRRFYGVTDVHTELRCLGKASSTDDELLNAIFDIIQKVRGPSSGSAVTAMHSRG